MDTIINGHFNKFHDFRNLNELIITLVLPKNKNKKWIDHYIKNSVDQLSSTIKHEIHYSILSTMHLEKKKKILSTMHDLVSINNWTVIKFHGFKPIAG